MTEPITVSLVHGTWAKHAAWTAPGSPLQTALRAAFEGIKVDAFQWSSWNRFSARHRAAEELAEKIKSTTGRHYIIAHSHGGNVAIEATRSQENRVAGLICLNTPFFIALGRESFNLFALVFALIYLTILWILFGLWSHYEWHWLTVTTLGLVTLGSTGLIFSSVGGPSWARNRERNLRKILEPPTLRFTTVLCLTTTEDEAYGWLSFFETVANLPFLLMARWLFFPIWVLALILISANVLPVLSVPWELWDGTKLTVLSGWQWWTYFIGSTFFYPAIVFFAGVMLAAGSSLLLVAIPYGNWKYPDANFFVRIIVSLIPIGSRSVEFREFGPDTAGLRHSVLYQDSEVVNSIVEWIRATEASHTVAQQGAPGDAPKAARP